MPNTIPIVDINTGKRIDKPADSGSVSQPTPVANIDTLKPAPTQKSADTNTKSADTNTKKDYTSTITNAGNTNTLTNAGDTNTLTDDQYANFIKNNPSFKVDETSFNDLIAKKRAEQDARLAALESQLIQRKEQIARNTRQAEGLAAVRAAATGLGGSNLLQSEAAVAATKQQQDNTTAENEINAKKNEVISVASDYIYKLQQDRTEALQKGPAAFKDFQSILQKRTEEAANNLIDSAVNQDIQSVDQLGQSYIDALKKLGVSPEAFLTKVESRRLDLGKKAVAANPLTKVGAGQQVYRINPLTGKQELVVDNITNQILKISPGQKAYTYDPVDGNVKEIANNPKIAIAKAGASNESYKNNQILGGVPVKWLRQNNFLDVSNTSELIVTSGETQDLIKSINDAIANNTNTSGLAADIAGVTRYLSSGSNVDPVYKNLETAISNFANKIRKFYAGVGVTGTEKQLSEQYLPAIGRDSPEDMKRKIDYIVGISQNNIDNLYDIWEKGGGDQNIRVLTTSKSKEVDKSKVETTTGSNTTTAPVVRKLRGGGTYTVE